VPIIARALRRYEESLVDLPSLKALSTNREAGDLIGQRKPRCTFLMFGQVARPHCGGQLQQLEAVDSQVQEILEPLDSIGFDVSVILATNSCGGEWNLSLRTAYARFLSSVTLDDCSSSKDHRCLLRRALGLWDALQRGDRAGDHDIVVLTRPDMLWRHGRGSGLVVAMAHLASNGQFAWPFRCEDAAWNRWKCVADTIVALPAARLAAYRKSCLGMLSCHPDGRDDGIIKMFDDPGGRRVGYDISGGYSGHGCYRCMEQAITRATSGGNITSSSLAGTNLGFALEESLIVNPRASDGGASRFYSFVGSQSS